MKGAVAFLAVLLLMLLAIRNSSFAFAAEKEDAKWAIVVAEGKIMDCYEAVAEADETGANVTDLLDVLEESGWLLSRAELAYRDGDFGAALNFSDESNIELEGLVDEAWALKEEALETGYWDFMVFFVGSLVGGGLMVISGFLVWFWLKRRFGVGTVRNYGLLFFVVVGVLALLVASPGLSRLLVYPRTEFFTELWLLDANRSAKDYPFIVSAGEEYNVFLGVGNRLGYCAYYVVQVKFRNQTQPEPSSFGPIEDRVPSNVSSLLDVRFFVADEQVWEMPLTFSFDYGFNEALAQVEFTSFTLNGAVSDLGSQVVGWDAVNREFRGFLFFEAWLYDAEADAFAFHGRSVSLRLNMTV